ncbi:MAG: hypothetical protein U5K54_20390 [Cytophagales bacterium]|nr:hypothetical protein [Cytophagales bacterium]
MKAKLRLLLFPEKTGLFQILNDHAPLVSLLKEGVVEYKSKELSEHMCISPEAL